MSADNYYLVVKHPAGGYSAVMCWASVDYEHDCPPGQRDEYTAPTPSVYVFDPVLEEKYEQVRRALTAQGVSRDDDYDTYFSAVLSELAKVGLTDEHRWLRQRRSDEQFMSFDAAMEFARAQDAEYGPQVHPLVAAEVAAERESRKQTGWIDPTDRHQMLLNDIQLAELSALTAHAPELCPSLRALLATVSG